jgi:methionyl-tRNA formyltransferase
MAEAMLTLQETGCLNAKQQDETLVTYAHKVEKAESILDWQKAAVELSRQIRAFNPFPVATAKFREGTCRIWFATVLNENTIAKTGEIIALDQHIDVACGQQVLRIQELQMPGGKRQKAVQFIQGQHVKIGEFFK